MVRNLPGYLTYQVLEQNCDELGFTMLGLLMTVLDCESFSLSHRGISAGRFP